jgi:predicted ATP-grasp superfamily ATP-dependent carboligase
LSFSTALLDSVRVQTDAKDKTLYALRDVASVGVREGALLVTCFEAEVRLFSILRRRLEWRR